MSTSKTTTKLGLPLPQPGDKPDWYDLGALCQLLENLFGAANGFATLDKDGNAVQMPAGAVPNTRKILGNPLSDDITLAQAIAAGLCPAPESGVWTPTLYGGNVAGSPTYSLQKGRFDVIGNKVSIRGQIIITSKGGMDGTLHIGSLPFVSDIAIPAAAGFTFGMIENPNIRISASIYAYSNHIELWNMEQTRDMLVSDITDTFSIFAFSGEYFKV